MTTLVSLEVTRRQKEKEELKQIKLERNQSVVLYLNKKNKELGWFKNGNEEIDDKYLGKAETCLKYWAAYS